MGGGPAQLKMFAEGVFLVLTYGILVLVGLVVLVALWMALRWMVRWVLV